MVVSWWIVFFCAVKALQNECFMTSVNNGTYSVIVCVKVNT